MPSAWAAIWQWLARRHPPATSSAGDEPTGAVAGEPQPPPAPIVAPPPAPAAPVTRPSRLSIVGTRRRFLAGPRLRYYESPNQGDAFAVPPDMILLHYTASGTTDSAIATLCDATAPSRVSAHVVIGRDGQVVQLVPLDTVAWHAGTSTWQGRTNVNSRALGIELVNWGRLDGEPGAWRNWCGKDVSDTHTFHAAGMTSGWHAYPEPQIAAVIELVRVLAAALPIRWLLGHEQVAPGRKHDPGPAFPWQRVRAACGFAATGERA
jgi:N-acetyl-anhydromuramyl-L-alanine amidase AmpD